MSVPRCAGGAVVAAFVLHGAPQQTMPCRSLGRKPVRATGLSIFEVSSKYVGFYLMSELLVTVMATLRAGQVPDRETLRAAVRELLAELTARAPGRSVEVRIPPYGAVSCVEGPKHTRGTPPNVVETDPVTWLEIATGHLTWHDAISTGRIRASGRRADLSEYLPLVDGGNVDSA